MGHLSHCVCFCGDSNKAIQYCKVLLVKEELKILKILVQKKFPLDFFFQLDAFFYGAYMHTGKKFSNWLLTRILASSMG